MSFKNYNVDNTKRFRLVSFTSGINDTYHPTVRSALDELDYRDGGIWDRRLGEYIHIQVAGMSVKEDREPPT